MKSKIAIDIHKSGTLNDAIVRMVTNHNEGKTIVTQTLMKYRLECFQAEWASISPEFEILHSHDGNTLHISENEKPIISLTWKEVHELTETEADLLTQQNLS